MENDIQAVYLRGYLNFISDQESWRKADSKDRRLSPAIFAKVALFWEINVRSGMRNW